MQRLAFKRWVEEVKQKAEVRNERYLFAFESGEEFFAAFIQGNRLSVARFTAVNGDTKFTTKTPEDAQYHDFRMSISEAAATLAYATEATDISPMGERLAKLHLDTVKAMWSHKRINLGTERYWDNRWIPFSSLLPF